MNREETIERLCAVATRVGLEVFNSREAHDCFCRLAGNVKGFTMSPAIIIYIENVVQAAIDKVEKCAQ